MNALLQAGAGVNFQCGWVSTSFTMKLFDSVVVQLFEPMDGSDAKYSFTYP